MNLLILAEKAVIFALIILIVILIFWKLSRIRKENNQGWKIAKGTEGHYFYCEKIGKEWKEIEFEGKHYAPGFPRHVIYTEKDWSDYPEWVKENQEVIKLRLKKRFKHPEYTFVDKETNQAIDLDTWFSEDEDHSELLDR